jgi:hypothetical protein
MEVPDVGRWSRGMIPRLQRGDQEFESPPAHLKSFINILKLLIFNDLLF